ALRECGEDVSCPKIELAFRSVPMGPAWLAGSHRASRFSLSLRQRTLRGHAGMSEKGHSRRFDGRPATSGLPPSTDFVRTAQQVRFVPRADIVMAAILRQEIELL